MHNINIHSRLISSVWRTGGEIFPRENISEDKGNYHFLFYIFLYHFELIAQASRSSFDKGNC